MIWFACYIATIFLANLTLREFGIVNIGGGLMAPAGVFWAGLAFSFRDFTHEALGRTGVLMAIILGSLLSFTLEDAQRIALASGLAFGLSELADMLVYVRLRERSWLASIAASNTVGSIIDSGLFLWVAFGSLAFIEGLVVGKLAMILPVILLLSIWRARQRSAISQAA